MSDEPNLAFDVDALFEHLTENLGHNLEDEKEWTYIVRSSDYQALEDAASEFEEEFAIHLHQHVEEEDEEGNVSKGDPIMCVIRVDALSAEQVKEIAQRVDAVAAARGLDYEGVHCYDSVDEQALLEWLAPEDAAWRLRALTDSGLEPDAELPWTILVVAPDVPETDKIAADLAAAGFDDFDQFDERDEEGDCGVCLFVPGTNNEAALQATMQKVAQVAEPHGGQLVAVQFYSREEFIEVFGVEGDGEEE